MGIYAKLNFQWIIEVVQPNSLSIKSLKIKKPVNQIDGHFVAVGGGVEPPRGS
jgi:hypothetical protein